jgi:hypothetical protein
MKKTAFFLAFISALSVISCDQDIDLTAGWKDIPIVYGLLNAADTAHYIRVEKAFQDQNGNAFLAAQEPDSLYYTNATVRLLNLTTGKEAVLQKVDGAAEGYPREGGDFAQVPNYLYKVRKSNFPISGGDEVRFILERGDQLEVVTAECVVLDEIVPQSLTPGAKLDFPTNRDVSFRWRAGEEARIFDLSLVIHYDEKLSNDPNVQSKELVWPIAKNLKKTDSSPIITAKVFGLEFYNFMADHIEIIPGATRLLTSIDVVIKGGGEAVEQYISIALANTGITSAQEIPVYTNLSEGLGIFTSVVETSVSGLTLTADSDNYLSTSEITQSLNFQ